MNFLTITILSGAIYDLFKCGLSITKNELASKLKNWLIDDVTLEKITDKLQELNLNEDMSEKAIEKKIDSSKELKNLLGNISASASNVNTQIHLGTGDNIIGNKIINRNNNE